MKCVIPANNVKVFGRAIQALSRIGDDVHVQMTSDRLHLRTVNSSRSAYAVVTLHRPFFSQFSSEHSASDKNNNNNSCRVSLKSCTFPFRSLASLEKTVERCCVSVDTRNLTFTVQLDCKHHVHKTYVLPFIETEQVQAVYSTEDAANCLHAEARMLHEMLLNFQSGQEEVTLSVSQSHVTIRNYTDDDTADSSGSVHTALTVSACEFESVRQTGGSDASSHVTFCLRELRAVLHLAEPLKLHVRVHFNCGGKPIVFHVHDGDLFEAHFVLATLADCDEQQTHETGTHQDTSACEADVSTTTRDQHSSINNNNNSISTSEVVEGGVIPASCKPTTTPCLPSPPPPPSPPHRHVIQSPCNDSMLKSARAQQNNNCISGGDDVIQCVGDDVIHRRRHRSLFPPRCFNNTLAADSGVTSSEPMLRVLAPDSDCDDT